MFRRTPGAKVRSGDRRGSSRFHEIGKISERRHYIRSKVALPLREAPFRNEAQLAVTLSSLDLAILRCLQEDARQPLVQIARALDQPESTIRHRLARLVREELVSFVAVSDPLKLGYPLWVHIGLTVELSRVHAVAEALEPCPEVYFVAITSGGFQMMLSAAFRSNSELVRFLTETLAAIPGITGCTTYHYLAVTKRRIGILPPAPEDVSA